MITVIVPKRSGRVQHTIERMKEEFKDKPIQFVEYRGLTADDYQKEALRTAGEHAGR